VLRDAHFMSIADRSILACWGVNGGKAGRPFQITVDPGGPEEHDVDALADAEPLPAGTVVRIRTTGGGGWGDPLERPVEEVLRDVAWRKVSVAGARDDYGVVIGDDGTADAAATEELRASMRAARTGDEPFFDRGPGYARLSGGAPWNEFDVL
jgi:N-methylhydantoinase B